MFKNEIKACVTLNLFVATTLTKQYFVGFSEVFYDIYS